MAYPSHVSIAQRRTLARLSELSIAEDLYLAGGVGVAWHVDHRSSTALDLFSRSASFDLDRASEEIAESFGSAYRVVGRSGVTRGARTSRAVDKSSPAGEAEPAQR